MNAVDILRADTYSNGILMVGSKFSQPVECRHPEQESNFKLREVWRSNEGTEARTRGGALPSVNQPMQAKAYRLIDKAYSIILVILNNVFTSHTISIRNTRLNIMYTVRNTPSAM